MPANIRPTLTTAQKLMNDALEYDACDTGHETVSNIAGDADGDWLQCDSCRILFWEPRRIRA